MAIRTVGALVVNPRRRRKAQANPRRVRKNALAIRTNRRRRSRKVKVVTNRRRRVVRTNRRRRVARRNPLAVRTNPRRRRARRNGYTVLRYNKRRSRRRANPLAIRTNRRRRSRRNPYSVLRYNPLAIRTNGRRRRSRKVYVMNGRRRHHVRRNSGALGGIGAMFRKIPVIGGLLAQVVNFAGPAVFGAIGVEPILLLTKFAAPYVPFIPTSLYYPVAGLVLAALVQKFAPVSPAMKEKLAIGIASGAGAVGYYKWRTGSDLEVAHEAHGLDMAGVYSGWGNGGVQMVVPFAQR